ncbi:hypothetical protein E2C01_071706 [Portunus trituberculatus]|uniref:Uncharacterized protein n=1 Tax=Portunus trituberculatus TaxID=210409 RepID=A0A5B7I545_PORTR|nr:hypothetical protein [Portunus trituberculatus]
MVTLKTSKRGLVFYDKLLHDAFLLYLVRVFRDNDVTASFSSFSSSSLRVKVHPELRMNFK